MPGLRHEFYISSLFFKPPCKITGYHPFFPTNHTQSINPTPPPRHQCPCLCPRRPHFVANFCWHSNFTQPQFSIKQMAHYSLFCLVFFVLPVLFIFLPVLFPPPPSPPPHRTCCYHVRRTTRRYQSFLLLLFLLLFAQKEHG